MKDKKVYLIIIIILLVLFIALCYMFINPNVSIDSIISTSSNSDSESVEYLESISEIESNVDLDNGDTKIDWNSYQETEFEISDSITITQDGIYRISGTTENGYIKVNTNGNVKIILDNVNITNKSGPAIIVENAENIVIELLENSVNYLEDGESFVGYDEDVNGTIYSKSDIIFEGSGTLNLIANYQDGIVGKDDLKIISGIYIITSVDDAIRGKDSVYIIDGTFNIEAEGDGIKSTNDSDDGKGFIQIDGGIFNINSTLDGIDAQTKLIINGGTYIVTTGGGSTNSSTDYSNWGNWKMNDKRNDESNSSENSSESAKGLKADGNVILTNGTFEFDTSDDAIHSNSYIGILGGNFDIKSGDDGIHADGEIIIENEDTIINIEKSYEGVEASIIVISNGTINIVSTDDGINVAGGTDSSSMGRIGENNFMNSSSNDYKLIINNGSIYVNASGDGIDVNGSAYMYDGYVIVEGPTDSENGALDYDGVFDVYGGTIIAVGSSGMAQSLSSTSTQYNVIITTNSNVENTSFSISNNSTEENIVEYTPSKSYSSIIVSSKEFSNGETYTLKISDEEYITFTISSITTNVGNSQNNMNNGQKQGRH